jgi:dTDP-4-dehydrorhamnose reductase
MKKILVIGSTGNLGSYFINSFCGDVYGTYFNSLQPRTSHMIYLDALDIDTIISLVEKIRPDLIINCSGFVNVDQCETFPEKAWLINYTIATNIAYVAKIYTIELVHMSTDHFFSNSDSDISEDSEVICINQYGFSKLSAEKSLLEIYSKTIIIRMNFFSIRTYGNTFLDFAVQKSQNEKNDETITGFVDVLFTPISAKRIVEVINKLVIIGFSGVINVSSNDPISKFDFLILVLNSLGISTKKVCGGSINDALLKARRPKNMTLNNKRLRSLLTEVNLDLYDMILEEVAVYKSMQSEVTNEKFRR